MLNKEIANYITYINHKPQRLKENKAFAPTLTWKTQFGFDELLRITNSPGRQEVLVVVGPNFWSRVEVG